jgi:membrane protease YdiL (CAAX protease family)
MTAGGKLFLVGLAVSLVGAGVMLVEHDIPRSAAALATDPLASGLAAGTVFMIVACFVYVLQPAFRPALAERVPYATVRTSLAMLLVATVVANMISLPALLRLGRPLAAGESGSGPVLGPLGLSFLILASEAPIIGVVWVRLIRPRLLRWHDLGFRSRPLGEHLARGVVGGAALFLTAAAVGLVLTRIGVRQNQYERFSGIQGTPVGLFLLAVLAGCVIAPLAEELFFRGYIFQTFSARYGRVWAYLFSAGLFAVVHANAAAAAPIFVLGLMLAYIVQSSGSILPGVIAHGLNNAIAFALLYAGVTG